MNNPFTFAFGKKPLQFISRISQTNEILENFNANNPSRQIYMITGVRGVGKTVMMTEVAGKLKEMEEWIVVGLNSTRDLLQSLAAKLYSLPDILNYTAVRKQYMDIFGLDKKVVLEMAKSGETKVKSIRENLGMKSELFSIYRERLKRKGILDTRTYGEVSFILPRFAEFALTHMYH